MIKNCPSLPMDLRYPDNLSDSAGSCSVYQFTHRFSKEKGPMRISIHIGPFKAIIHFVLPEGNLRQQHPP